MAYATLVELKAEIQKTDAGDDATLTRLLASAEYEINRICNRPDGFEADAAASARYYRGNGLAYLLIEECVEITEVAVKDAVTDTTYTAWASPTTNMAGDGDWMAFSGDNEDPDFNSLPYDSIMVDPNGDYTVFTSGRYFGLRGFRPISNQRRNLPTVRVTARWGYSDTVPPPIRTATIFLAAIAYKRLQSSGASVLASTELGVLEFFRPMDPKVKEILVLGRFVRPVTGRW